MTDADEDGGKSDVQLSNMEFPLFTALDTADAMLKVLKVEVLLQSLK